MTTYANLTIIMDGAIRLYQDADLKGDTWQCRLSVPGLKKPYIRSTKTNDLDAAKKFATKLFNKLCYEVEHGIPVGEKTFRDVHKDFMKDNEHLLSVHRKTLHTGTATRYFIPFFGDKPIKHVDEACLAAYWQWRFTYWSAGPGAGLKVPNAAKVPAQKSMDMEKSMLNQILKYAKVKKCITNMPLVERPKIGGAKNANTVSRRPAFTPAEMKKLTSYMDTWITEGPTKRHRNQRQIIRAMCLVFYYTGLRPNELFQLRWCDCRTVGDSWILTVAPTTKTGARDAAGQPSLGDILLSAAQAQGFDAIPEDSEALVFPNQEGEPRDWYNQTFKGLFNDAGVLKDNLGRNHTPYSLRHTYITERLLAGVDVYKLANACGTSVQYIRKHYDHTDTEMFIDELTKTKEEPTPPTIESAHNVLAEPKYAFDLSD